MGQAHYKTVSMLEEERCYCGAGWPCPAAVPVPTKPMTKPKSLEELLALPDSCTIRELPLLEQATEMARRLRAVVKQHQPRSKKDYGEVICFCGWLWPCPTVRALNGEIE